MESLIKQTWARYSGVGGGNKDQTVGIQDQRIPPQKTQSFKGDKKKSVTWLLRQFSGKMNRDYDSSDNSDYSTAVAAAAFAISSLQESNISDQKRTSDAPAPSFAEITSEASMKNSEVQEERVPIRGATMEKIRPTFQAVSPAPPIKKTPTFPDKRLDNTASVKPETATPKYDLQSTKQSSIPQTEIRSQSSAKPGVGETSADAWEKAEIAKIKARYEKVNATILDWESKKKTKANRGWDRRESELERKRAKALKHYRSEMERINQIADGARAQATENRRNEEFKVKEKANKIRSTGKFPAKCFCF